MCSPGMFPVRQSSSSRLVALLGVGGSQVHPPASISLGQSPRAASMAMHDTLHLSRPLPFRASSIRWLERGRRRAQSFPHPDIR